MKKKNALFQVVFVAVILFIMSSILFGLKYSSASQTNAATSNNTGWQPALVSDQRGATTVMHQQLDYFQHDQYGKAFAMMAPDRFDGLPITQVVAWFDQHNPELMHSRSVIVSGADTNDDRSVVRLHLIVTGQNGQTVKIDYMVFTDGGRYIIGGWRRVDPY